MFNVFFRCHTGNDDGAPKRLKKCREIIFMKFVIASLVTRLNFDESKKLICENCHSVPVIRGAAKHFCDKLFSRTPISANLLFPFPISAFYRRQSEREQINQSLRLHRKPQVHSVFFLVNLLFDFIINYSNWLSWLMTRPGCEKQQKNGPNAHWKTDCHCILYTLKYVFLVKCSIMLLVIFGLF